MAVSFVKFNSFVEALSEKVHNLQSDVLTIALCNTANAPVASNTKLADLVQISYTNLSSRVLTVASSSQTAGVYKLFLNDLILTATTGTVATFQYVVIYNDTATNDELIGYYNPGGSLTLNIGDSLTLDFDGTNGVIQLT